jgi:hypothetical protein
MSTGVYRADLEIESLPAEGITGEDVINAHNKLVSAYNFISKNMSLQSNFNCYIAKVTLAAAGDSAGRDTQVVQHFLGVVPKYRIILRQEGNGVITDIPSGWTSDVVTLYNNGAVEVSITVMIVRE